MSDKVVTALVAIGRSIFRLVVWSGLSVAALSAVLIAFLPERPGGLGFGRPPPPTIESFAAVGVMVFSIVGIVSAARERREKSAMVAHALVLAIGAVALWRLPDWSWLVTGGAFGLLIAAPWWLAAVSYRQGDAGDWPRAAAWWRLATFLHPSRTMRLYAAVLRARTCKSLDAELAAYASLKRNATAGEAAVIDCSAAAVRDDWASVLGLARGVPGWTMYEIRALGELGRVEEMIAVFAAMQPKPRRRDLDQIWLTVLAFAGRVDAVRVLLRGKLRFVRPEKAAYWSFIAADAAGVADESRRALAEHARESDDEAFRRAAQRHLAAPPARQTLSPAATAAIAQIEAALPHRADGRSGEK